MRQVRWDRTVRRGARLLGSLGVVLATPSCMTRMLREIDAPVSRVVHLGRPISGQVVLETAAPVSGRLLVGLTPDPEAAGAVHGAGAATTGERHSRCLELREQERHGCDLFAKIVLTPRIVVADVVSLTAVVWLWEAITDDD